MKDKIRVKFIEDPDDARFIKDTHVNLDIKQAFEFFQKGVAVGYNRNTKEEFNPFLSDEFPYKEILFDSGIYTEEQLKKVLENIDELDGIGSKTKQKYKQILNIDPVGDDAVSYDSVTDSLDFISEE